MASTDARPIPQKGVAYRAYFPIYDADGALVSGATGLDSEVSKDGAAFADATNEATEIGSSGLYYLDLTATEMNADAVIVVVKSTEGLTQPIILYPEESGDLRVNVTQIEGGDATDQIAAVVVAATGDVNSRIPAALVGGRMDSNVGAISGDSGAADKLELSAGSIESGAAVGGTLSTTQMSTDLTESTDDHYIGRVIIWTSGSLLRQATVITDYDGSGKVLTFEAVTEAPSAGDGFIIV